MNPRLKYAFGIAMAVLVIMTIALVPDYPTLKKNNLDTHVLESNALYFKNLRQFYYDISEDERSGYFMYDHPDQRVFSSSAPRFMIVDNWRDDQAYIILNRPTDIKEDGTLEIRYGEQLTQYPLGDLNAVESLQLCASIFESMANDSVQFAIATPEGSQEIWETQDQRRVVKTILKDYFKLVGAL